MDTSEFEDDVYHDSCYCQNPLFAGWITPTTIEECWYKSPFSVVLLPRCSFLLNEVRFEDDAILL